MDAQIGRILDALEASGKSDDTVIVFSADHGLAVGHHGFVGKQNMYEHSLRPPLIMAGPGLPKGEVIDTRVYYQDIMPTTLELAGTSVPGHVEFRSLLPLVRGEREEQYSRIYGAYQLKEQRAIIQDDFKLIYYPRIDRLRLYNLKEDPLELTDLADDPDYFDEVNRLRSSLATLQAEMQDPVVLGL